MVTKNEKNIADKAIDIAFAKVQKESGITAMDLFMVGLGYAGVGLHIVHASWTPGNLKVLSGFIIATGIFAMSTISRKH